MNNFERKKIVFFSWEKSWLLENLLYENDNYRKVYILVYFYKFVFCMFLFIDELSGFLNKLMCILMFLIYR